jgi:hypothetical protein
MDFENLSGLFTPWCVHAVATLRITDHLMAAMRILTISPPRQALIVIHYTACCGTW